MCCARTAAAAAASESSDNEKKRASNDLDAKMKIEATAIEIAKSVSAASATFRKPASFVPSYGTAGFRDEASLLDSTLFR